jgi:glycosyltransferase involved in cell wall biosynthesis
MKSRIAQPKGILFFKQQYRKFFLLGLDQKNQQLRQKISALRKTREKYLALREEYLALKKRYKAILPPASSWRRYLLSCFDFTYYCASRAPEAEYDVCLAHNHRSLAAAFEFAGRNQADVVFDAVEITHRRHAAGPAAQEFSKDEPGAGFIEMYEGSFIEQCAGIFTVSPGLQKWLADNYSISKPVLLRNCREYVPMERNTEIRSFCNLKSGDRLILYVGSSYQNQGVEQVLNALAGLPEKYHFATLGLWRDDEYQAEINSLAAQLGVENRVHFLEPVPSVELVSFASGADFGIIPRQATSLNNQFSLPNRIFEIVMARLPVAVGNLPDLKGLVNDLQTGVVFDEQSPESIADSIFRLEQLAASPDMEERLEKAAADLSWDNEKKNLVELVAKLNRNRAVRSVAVFANKSVRTNNRLYRICKTLAENNYEVTFFSKDDPEPELKIPGVVYFNSVQVDSPDDSHPDSLPECSGVD